MKKTADISECGKYRYSLTRVWGDRGDLFKPSWYEPDSRVVFIGLNPSTADAVDDDPTIRRCIRFAESWGYGGLIMLNAFPYRTKHPRVLRNAWNRGEVINDERNNSVIYQTTKAHSSVVVCWGAHSIIKEYGGRGRDVELMEEFIAVRPMCLGITKGGHPQHPLFIPRDRARVPFRLRAIQSPSECE